MTKTENKIKDLIDAYEEAHKLLCLTNKRCYQILCDKLDAKIMLLTCPTKPKAKTGGEQ